MCCDCLVCYLTWMWKHVSSFVKNETLPAMSVRWMALPSVRSMALNATVVKYVYAFQVVCRDAAIMFIFLLIMLFRNAQNVVRLCLRWPLIMPKLFRYSLHMGEGLAFVSCFLVMSACVGAFGLSNNATVSHWQVELIFLRGNCSYIASYHALYPGFLIIWVYLCQPLLSTCTNI